MQVQHSRSMNSYILGAPKFDFVRMMAVAAHDRRWKDIFAPLAISDTEHSAQST